MWWFFHANTSCHAITLTSDSLTLKVWWHVVTVCTKFDRNWTIPGWVIHNLANLCSRYISLWPWPLTPWPWTFVVLRASCVQSLCKIWAKSNNPRKTYWWFSTFSPSNFWPRPKPPNRSQGCVDRTAPNLQGHRVNIADLPVCFKLRYLAVFSNACRSNSSYVEIDAKFRTFWPP